ncbi:MAG: RnfABCDGE type electron transport complex subunit G [Clostridia bacterium]|nr:RnfABCDGE type electron transport complex subunit G [Clostridia bacterium]
MKKIIKDALMLFLITLVSGLALAAVYEITKAPIETAELAERAEAYRVVFADATDFESDETVDAAVADSAKALSDAGFSPVSVSDALYAVDGNGNRIGCVMTVNAKGYGGTIQFTMGVTGDKISGISILSHSETAGLGALCTEESFYGQFAGKPAEPLKVIKTGATEPNEVDVISGATVTTNGITDGVNAGIWFAQNVLKIEGGAE